MLKKVPTLFLIAVLCAGADRVAAQTPTLPTLGFAVDAGLWQFQTKAEGLPIGDGEKTGQVCITAQQTTSPELHFLAASMGVMRPSEDKSKVPKCSLDKLQRAGQSPAATSSWTAQCDGPRGAMTGTGKASLQAQSLTLEQQFELNLIGKRTLKQTVHAQYIGACN